MRFIPVFLCVLIAGYATAQRSIRGKVLNETTGLAVPGSSVFITNTSKGTVSASDGSFELTDVPAGKHELIISSIGYETVVHGFTDAQLPLQLKVLLKIKVKELENVTVEPSVEEGWDKWGKTFTDNFLGYTENALRCRIKNEKAIRFRYFKKSRRLIAYCDEPILIENKALGYTISYQLEDFEVNFMNRSSVYLGYSLYEENAKDRKAWSRRREDAYHGSMMHFLRSLYIDSLAANGFEVRRMVRVPNEEKERVKRIFRESFTPAAGGNTTVTINGTGNIMTGGFDGRFAPDSAAYYRAVMKQDDYVDHYGKTLLTADSLIAKQDGEYKLLYFPDYLYVTYKNELEPEAYLRYYGQNRKPSYQRSLLVLHEGMPIWIERNGNYYNPKDILSMAYWGWSEKFGDSLPLDYSPGK